MKKHNGLISLYKFLFCMMIVIFHFFEFATPKDTIIFYGGAIAVEFFFLVSGYLLGKKCINDMSKNDDTIAIDTLQLVFKKIKSFFPVIFIVWLINLILKLYFTGFNIYTLLNSMFDLLPFNILGYSTSDLNNPLWYIGSLLICCMIIYPLCRKYKKNYIYIIAPLLVLFIGGYFSHNFIHLRKPLDMVGIFSRGLLRGFFEMNIGVIAYVICEKFKKIKFTKLSSILLLVFELIALTFPFIVAQFVDNFLKYDFIVVVILFLGIICAFSEKAYKQELFNNKYFYRLERLSLIMYVCHLFCYKLICYTDVFNNHSYYFRLAFYLVIVILLTELIDLLLRFLKKHKYFIPKFKKYFICE